MLVADSKITKFTETKKGRKEIKKVRSKDQGQVIETAKFRRGLTKPRSKPISFLPTRIVRGVL